jgi:hypothetical protein
MSVNILDNYVRMDLVASAARIADGTSGALELVNGLHSGVFILVASAVTGTSPTLDLGIQVSPDNGTTFFTMFRFAQITSAVTRRLAVKFVVADAGSEALIDSADPTGGALSVGVPITKWIAIRWNIGGTNPSFTFRVHFYGIPLSRGNAFA